MAKSRRKNYKLRRRVMRTVAALTMIMAIVVAAIPVENYGTMRAAGDDWDYKEASNENNTDPYSGKNFSTSVQTQTLTDALLSDSVEVQADSSGYGADAIISQYNGNATELDITGRMYYNYAYFVREDVVQWSQDMQSQGDSFTVTFEKESTTTNVPAPNGVTDTAVTIPAKFSMTNPRLTPNLQPVSGGTINGYKTERRSSFTYDEIKSLIGEFQTFEDEVIVKYNNDVQEFIDRSTRITNEAEWTGFKNDLDTFKNTTVSNSKTVDINSEIGFTTYQNFWLRYFCQRVIYSVRVGIERDIPLTNFELFERNKRASDGGADEYVYVAHCIDTTALEETYKSYVDGSGYLADGFVKIVGVGDNAFNKTKNAGTSTITSIKLPDTILGIGNSAFEDSGLTSIEFHPDKCRVIGNRAFYGCEISNIDLTGGENGVSMISEIGNNAFYKTGLTEITFPGSLTKLGKGSFAETPLTKIEFQPGNNNLIVDEYAFYNCPAIAGISFAQNKPIQIMKGAFAMSKDNTGGEQLTEFVFPDTMSWESDSNKNDYILAGRRSMENVTFPARMNELIPQSTFAGCPNLAVVTLGKISYGEDIGQNIQLTAPAEAENKELFRDVTNKSFYVQGPAIKYGGGPNDKSTGRKDALNCKMAVDTVDENYVPYKFIDSAGEIRIEQKIDQDVIAEIRVLNDNEGEKTAQLTKYSISSSTGDIPEVTIENNIAGYRIVSLGADCFKPLQGRMKKLVIKNNSLSEIGDNALRDFEGLEEVWVGNSVASIGADAFAGCEDLSDVYFNKPLVNVDTDWASIMSIAPGAFKTNSDKLTFHGVIESGYAPFEYAMGKDTEGRDTGTEHFTSDSPNRNICYRTFEREADYSKEEKPEKDDIQKLKVMRDNATGVSTLVDYPHLKGSEVENVLTGGTLTEEQRQLLNAIFNIEVPDGIQSIDSKTFFTAVENRDNDWCIDSELLKHYRDSEEDKKDGKQSIGGLFSGLFEEQGVGGLIPNGLSNKPEFLKQGEYTEQLIRGNDHLTSITLGNTVTNLPEEYTFDSCENLVSVTLGNRIDNLGKLPFRGCKSLSVINTEGNNTFSTQNMILYKNNGTVENPVYEIYECFEGRGGEIVGGSTFVGEAEGDLIDNILSIADEAFSNCTFIQKVNLEGTKVESIPLDCFKGCEALKEVRLPNETREIKEGAFTNLGKSSIDVFIPNKDCVINAGSFDGETNVLFHGKQYDNETTGEKSTCYKTYLQLIDALFKNDPSISRDKWMNEKVVFVDAGNEYILTFVDKDLETIDVLKLNPKSPDNDRVPKDALVARDIPAAPEYTGLEFETWMCRVDAKNDKGYDVRIGTQPGDSAFTDIKEDRIFIPNYKFNPSKVVSCGGKHKLNVVGAEYILRTNTGEMITRFGTPIELDCAESITLMADTRNSTGKFLCWTVTCTNNEGDFTYLLTNASGEMTGFQMPHLENADSVVTITAMYSDTATRCEVVVEGGSGSGFYNGGDVVSIAASAPADSRQTFDRWIPDTSNPQVVSFVDSESARTTFVMPQLTAGQRIVIRASYKDFDPMEGDCELEVINGNGSGFYNVGDAVTISAYASNVENEVFDVWVVPNGQDAAPMPVSSATATITMPRSSMGGKITVTATYKQANSGNGGTNPDGTYTVTVNGGTGGGNYQPGATVTITANAAPTGQTFANWTTSTSGVSFANANSNSTTFVMPSSNVTVTANFNGGSTTGKHKVTVNYGSGSGEYEAGATVNITANAPESSSRVFSRWTTSNSGLGFANANAVSTSFVMPAADVTVTANYKTRSSSDDDDDDDSPSRRPGSNSNTTTVDNRPGSSTSTTTSTTGTVSNPASGTSSTSTPSNNNGNRIYITKNGISNTDVASLAVNGSTDNFIVRITESPDATAAVEQALTNTYGSLNGLAYLPMDISLYDSTGQNKISDTTGLNITVTMPIPDVLIQYGGNARVAAADNGALQQITPRFTTIDGIACVSFVPQHFSPYVIYVDTNNLIAGQMYDTTPATGDPIHPKWFAAIGMACVSILLFVMSDGRKRKKYRAA